MTELLLLSLEYSGVGPNDLFPFESKNPLIMLSAKTQFLQYIRIMKWHNTIIIRIKLPGSEHVYFMLPYFLPYIIIFFIYVGNTE